MTHEEKRDIVLEEKEKGEKFLVRASQRIGTTWEETYRFYRNYVSKDKLPKYYSIKEDEEIREFLKEICTKKWRYITDVKNRFPQYTTNQIYCMVAMMKKNGQIGAMVAKEKHPNEHFYQYTKEEDNIIIEEYIKDKSLYGKRVVARLPHREISSIYKRKNKLLGSKKNNV